MGAFHPQAPLSMVRSTLLFGICTAFLPDAVVAQSIPVDRTTDWSLAGLRSDPPPVEQTLNILDLGGSGDGITSNNAAINAAFAAAAGQMTVIEFPAGDYFFSAGINVPDSVILRGEGADATTFTFSIGGSGHCINISGIELPTTYPIIGGG